MMSIEQFLIREMNGVKIVDLLTFALGYLYQF